MIEHTFANGVPSPDALERSLLRAEALVARIRAHQLAVVHELDVAQVATLDGMRNLADWLASRLDMTVASAKSLVEASRRLQEHPGLMDRLIDGEASLDRALATARLADAGGDAETLERSAGWDLSGVEAAERRLRRHSRDRTRAGFAGRQVVLQPDLAEARWRLWGSLDAVGGELVDRALSEAMERLPAPPPGAGSAPWTRRADALVGIAVDSLDTEPPDGSDSTTQPLPRRVPMLSVFVDADLAAATAGEAGVELASGMRAGPDLLEQILCGGSVEVTGVSDGAPLMVTHTTRSVPPRMQRFIHWRDRSCVIDGCRSRHRLQVHHLVPRSQGGTDHPENLVLLCWYHHHVVIHRMGYRIDPHSPPQRRRFHRPTTRGPP